TASSPPAPRSTTATTDGGRLRSLHPPWRIPFSCGPLLTASAAAPASLGGAAALPIRRYSSKADGQIPDRVEPQENAEGTDHPSEHLAAVTGQPGVEPLQERVDPAVSEQPPPPANITAGRHITTQYPANTATVVGHARSATT